MSPKRDNGAHIPLEHVSKQQRTHSAHEHIGYISIFKFITHTQYYTIWGCKYFKSHKIEFANKSLLSLENVCIASYM